MVSLRLILISSTLFHFSGLYAQGSAFVSPVPQAQLLWRNPILNFAGPSSQDLMNAWAVRRVEHDTGRSLNVPTQTGRALLASEHFNLKGDILLKGTGLNSEQSSVESVGKIRYEVATKTAKIGDGMFTVRESFADMLNSETLRNAGVVVAKPIAIFSTGDRHSSSDAALGIYVREFLVQTRLSNLEVMSDEDVRTALDEAAEKLFRAGHTDRKLNRVELYFFLMKRMAHNVAILQKQSYRHNYLHSQQVTLAGELVDLGTGTWLDGYRQDSYGRPESLSYMSFENQPLLIQNMFVRSHSLTAEGGPVRLAAGSSTLKTQNHSLLGLYRRVDPQAASEIERSDPENLFWDFYRSAEKGTLSPTKMRARDYSPSFSAFAARHRFEFDSASMKKLSEQFEQIKLDWAVDQLPDVFIQQHLMKNQMRASWGPTPGRRAQSCRKMLQSLGSEKRGGRSHMF